MLRKGEIPLKVGREYPQLQHFRKVQTSGVNLQNIPRIIWGCPTQFLVDPNWGVKAGIESREKHAQILRESRIAEIIYLIDSDIPANPSVSPDAHDSHAADDSSVPLIPLNHIDEEASPGDVTGIPLLPLDTIDEKPLYDDDHGIVPPINTATIKEQTLTNDHGNIPLIPLNTIEEETPLGPPLIVGPEAGIQALLHRDEVIGSAVALVALIKSKEPGSQIDLELLIQLLRNPGMLDKLMKEHGLSSPITASAHPQVTPSAPSPIPWSTMGFRPTFAPLSVPRPKMVTEKLSSDTWAPSDPFAHSRSQEVKNIIDQIHRDSESQSGKSTSMAPMASIPNSSNDVGKMRKLINEYGNTSSPSASASNMVASKDPDYYRNLILQHGSMQQVQASEKPMGVNSAETRPKKPKLCVYFNSPQGCRHGPDCWFQHIKVSLEGRSWAPEEPSAKRMKPSGKVVDSRV